MKKPNDFDKATAYDGNSTRMTLTEGCHICRIQGAREETSRGGSEMLVVAFEIAEGGDLDGYYKDRHEFLTRYNTDAKWPGVFRSVVTRRDGSTNPFFKGLIAAIEESNPGYRFDFDNPATLRGKMVGFNFGLREYVKGDNTIGTIVEPFYAVSVQTVRAGTLQPPKPKLLDEHAQPAKPKAEADEFKEVDDEQLPF